MEAFRAAVEAGDFDAVADLLADDVRFTSPVAFKPYVGKPITAATWRGVGPGVRGFPPMSAGSSTPTGMTALIRDDRERPVGERLRRHPDRCRRPDRHVLVMVRPPGRAQALAAAMAAQFEQIQAEAMAEIAATPCLLKATPPCGPSFGGRRWRRDRVVVGLISDLRPWGKPCWSIVESPAGAQRGSRSVRRLAPPARQEWKHRRQRLAATRSAADARAAVGHGEAEPASDERGRASASGCCVEVRKVAAPSCGVSTMRLIR